MRAAVEQMIASTGHLAVEASLRLERLARGAIDVRGRFDVGVPGGSVATLFFPSFANAALDWPRVHVWFVDERVVPTTDPDSNFKAANEHWLSKVPAVAHPFTSAEAYDRELPRRLDVAVLGVGPDGHVASLFPGHAALEQRDRRAFNVDDSPKPPPKRLTLSLSELTSAREVWVVAIGAAKAQMVASALKPDSPLPVSRVLREAMHVRLWLDVEAAAQL
jgi:6-phosphogluconolactonase